MWCRLSFIPNVVYGRHSKAISMLEDSRLNILTFFYFMQFVVYFYKTIMLFQKKILLCCLFIAISGCNPSGLLSRMYGIKPLKKITLQDIGNTPSTWDILPKISYFIDSTYSNYFVKNADSSSLANKIRQPLQLFFYDQKGVLVSHIANCDVPGFPNLHWEKIMPISDNGANCCGYRDNNKALSPNLSLQEVPLLTLFEHLRLLKKGISPNTDILNKPEMPCSHTVIVHWAYFMGRQNDIFLKEVSKLKKSLGPDFCFLYVNADNSIF